MFRVLCFCCALVSAGSVFGQNYPQKVPGGSLVFVPDSVAVPQPLPEQPVYQEQPQVVVPPHTHQHQVVTQQGHRHANNCGCPVCKRQVLESKTRVKSHTLKEYTTVEVVREDHPPEEYNNTPIVQPHFIPRPNPCPPVYQPRNPCPPQNPCIPARNPCIHHHPHNSGGGGGGGLVPWNQGFTGYRPQQQRGGVGYAQRPQQSINLLGLVTISAGAGVSAGGGFTPSHAQSGYNQPWYGR